MTEWRGREFWKLVGSGNDFVFFDARTRPAGALATPGVIRALCARATGVGADGVVFLEPPESSEAALRMAYFNADGSRAAMCGNAALCTTRLAVELGAAPADGFALDTDSGLVHARLRDEDPEIDLTPIRDLTVAAREIRPMGDERRVGFARAGVPHLVVEVPDVAAIDLVARGRELRHHATLADGANVNFVSPTADGGWRMRTYERGVEGETLACGTGAVACAAVLAAWDGAPTDGRPTRIVSSSGRTLRVRLAEVNRRPSLGGEGRIVFRGALGDLG